MQQSRIAAILTLSLYGLMFMLAIPYRTQAAEQLVTVTGSLQEAIDAANPGDTLVLEAKAYSGKIDIAVSGTAQAPITIRGAGLDASTIQGGVVVDGSYLVLEDLTVDVGGADDDGVDINAPSHDVTLRRVHLHNGSGYGVRVGTDVTSVLIEQCVINNFDAGTSDAHGVGILTASNVTIKGCEIYGNSGDAIQVNTPDYPGYNRFATNIHIEGNRLHDNRENAVDIKSTDGLVFHNNLLWGYHAVSSSSGMAIQVQYGARNIVLTSNQIWASVEGIEVSRGVKSGTSYPIAPSNVLIAGNLIHDIVDDSGGDSGSGSGIVVRESSNVRVYNNTVVNTAGSAIYVGISSDGSYASGLNVRNNVLDGRLNDVRLSYDKTAGMTFDYNHYMNGIVNEKSLGDFVAAGYEAHATTGNPQLDANWQPITGSPLIDSGTPVDLEFQGAAPDRGWSELASAAPPPMPDPDPGSDPDPDPDPNPQPPVLDPDVYKYHAFLPILSEE
jgi:hypothetical protein